MIAVLANISTLVAAFPCNYHPFRQAFFSQLIGRDEFSDKENYIFTALIIGITCFISIIFPNIKQVISILGGLVAVQSSYMLPCLIQVKLSKKRWFETENLMPILFFGTLLFLGFGSVVITVYEVVTALDPPIMPRWQ